MNMEDRIEVNGVWYVKEDTLKKESFDKLGMADFTFVNKIVYEDARYLIEFHVLDYNNEYCMPSISIKNKDTDEFELWDSEEFLMNLLTNTITEDNLKTITIVDDYGLYVIKELLRMAEEKEYI